MKLACVFIALCIFAFTSFQVAVTGREVLSGKSATSLPSPTKTPPRRTTVPKSSGKAPTRYLTHRSHSATGSSTRSEKTSTRNTRVPKGSGKVPTHPTTPSTVTSTPKTPIIGTTSQQKPKSPTSRASNPTSTKTPKSSPATTTANFTITRNPSVVIPTPVTPSKTVTVRDGHTASAQVGWIVIGVGVGGSVSVGGNILHVAGGTEVIIEENSSGQDELSTIDSSTTSSTSKSSSKSASTSSSTSSSVASPTPYNIYPKLDSTSTQQLAFTQDLKRVAQPGSVRSITGGRGELLLWAASLTPAQASEIRHNPVVSPLCLAAVVVLT